MKWRHSLFLIAILLYVSSHSYSQKIRYKDVKDQYSIGEYYKVNDPKYSVIAAILLNFYVPGVGHMYVGELGRGVLFLGGAFLTTATTAVGLLTWSLNSEQGPDIFITGLGTSVIVYLWSVFNVIKVVKIKNIAYNELQSGKVQFSMTPQLGFQDNPYAGVRLCFTF